MNPKTIIMEPPIKYYVAYFDGACEPKNPNGNLGIGSFILNPERKQIFTYSKCILNKEMPVNSNNVAEYMALISVLEFAIKEKIEKNYWIIAGDSKMVIEQMKGNWGCNGGIYEPYYRKALELVNKFYSIRFEWIPREQNSRADELSKKALIEAGITITDRKKYH